MRAKTVVAIKIACRTQSGVDGVNHRQRVAPGVITTEQIAAQALHHKGLRGTKHLWLGAPETVNALLGVAHQKHAGRRTGAGIAGQPR